MFRKTLFRFCQTIEEQMISKLKSSLSATKATVEDISGGCGAMYNLQVESPMFKGKSRVQQHQMVNACLKEELKDAHGFNLKTKVSEE